MGKETGESTDYFSKYFAVKTFVNVYGCYYLYFNYGRILRNNSSRKIAMGFFASCLAADAVLFKMYMSDPDRRDMMVE